MSLLHYTVVDGLARITLNRPEKRNALNAELVAALRRALAQAGEDAQAVLLAGNGAVFCAGADLAETGALRGEGALREHAEAMGALLDAICALPVPSVAAVQGHALGAGCGLVSACDIVVAAPDAQFGYPEINNGILPALVTPPLVRALGRRRALALLMRETPLTAAEAQAQGLVAEIDADPLALAGTIASRLAGTRAGQMRRLKTLAELATRASAEESSRAAVAANLADRITREN